MIYSSIHLIKKRWEVGIYNLLIIIRKGTIRGYLILTLKSNCSLGQRIKDFPGLKESELVEGKRNLLPPLYEIEGPCQNVSIR
jgi:hypothetical protein